MTKLKLAVHKFTSCDGCQLAFLNAGEAFLLLSELVEIVHFVEAGLVNSDAVVDVAFVEGSVSTPDEVLRIKRIRANSTYLITIGACATAGGIQALRNAANYPQWLSSVYATPGTISSLSTSSAIATHVKVDLEVWGCPVSTEQVMQVLRELLQGAVPHIKRDAVCFECKRRGQVCVVVTKQEACMGPLTQTGCGALCPGVGRACYACYGPSENPNTAALIALFKRQGDSDATIATRFLQINNQAAAFNQAGNSFKGIKIVKE